MKTSTLLDTFKARATNPAAQRRDCALRNLRKASLAANRPTDRPIHLQLGELPDMMFAPEGEGVMEKQT